MTIPEKGNIFADIAAPGIHEQFADLLKGKHVRIERIVSNGHRSPENHWYDQNENEWVIVLKGEARVSYENGPGSVLREGDYIKIPAHLKHRVDWTSDETETIWLAVFYQ